MLCCAFGAFVAANSLVALKLTGSRLVQSLLRAALAFAAIGAAVTAFASFGGSAADGVTLRSIAPMCVGN